MVSELERKLMRTQRVRNPKKKNMVGSHLLFLITNKDFLWYYNNHQQHKQ